MQKNVKNPATFVEGFWPEFQARGRFIKYSMSGFFKIFFLYLLSYHLVNNAFFQSQIRMLSVESFFNHWSSSSLTMSLAYLIRSSGRDPAVLSLLLMYGCSEYWSCDILLLDIIFNFFIVTRIKVKIIWMYLLNFFFAFSCSAAASRFMANVDKSTFTFARFAS